MAEPHPPAIPSPTSDPARALRVAVVGHCASGKTTIVAALRNRGYDAYAVAQEHSGVSWLWRHSAPDVLLYLDVPLATVRQRRGEEWPQAVYDAQETRLAEARARAHLVLDTSKQGTTEAVARAVSFLESVRQGAGAA